MTNQSTFVACPVERLADSRLVMCWLMGDQPPGEMFSVPMSPTGQLPATHYALHAYMDSQALTDLASGVVPVGYRDLPCDLPMMGSIWSLASWRLVKRKRGKCTPVLERMFRRTMKRSWPLAD